MTPLFCFCLIFLTSLSHLLWQHVNAQLVLGGFGPQLNLRQNLVGERVAHDKAGVTVSAAQVDQTTFSQHDQVAPILQSVAINLIRTQQSVRHQPLC